MTTPPDLQQSIRLLIRANHILHKHDLVDAFGHISVRHALNSDQYLIAAYDPGAPALVKSRQDFIAYHVSDSTPVDDNAPQGYSERFIHGEVLKRFPHVNCVVHSHSEAVIPFSLAGRIVKPVVHMAGFLGHDAVPCLNMAEAYARRPDLQPDMLIKNKELGAILAAHLSDAQPVVLQHKHGFTTFGTSIEQAVYRAIYTQVNCRLLAQALEISEGGWSNVSTLTKDEARACAIMNEKCQDKSFRLWLREVQVNPLYENEEGEPKQGKVTGLNI
jgi:ribulose-5-phosphate 4-epimerase/fuculose-1-phosphate aldolase